METCLGFIRTQMDALLVAHATRLHLLPEVSERLRQRNKAKLRNGSIFCFSEEGTGMKRWTDGRVWSPSKVLGNFLVYREICPEEAAPRSGKRKLLLKERKVAEDKDEEYVLHKKTILINVDGRSYHVISYYVPVLEGRGLALGEFFQTIKAEFLMNQASDCTKEQKKRLEEKRDEYLEEMDEQLRLTEDKDIKLLKESAIRTLIELSTVAGCPNPGPRVSGEPPI